MACSLLPRASTRVVEVVHAGGAGGQSISARAVSQAEELHAVLGSLCSCRHVSFLLEAGITSGSLYLVPRLEIWEMLLDPECYGIQLAYGCGELNSITEVMPSAPVSLHVLRLL